MDFSAMTPLAICMDKIATAINLCNWFKKALTVTNSAINGETPLIHAPKLIKYAPSINIWDHHHVHPR